MPTLGGRVIAAPSGAHGFDSASVLSAQTARAMNQSGFQFCIRYLSRLSPQGRGDLSNTEAKGILDGGLALMAVQHVSKPGWVPNATLGRQCHSHRSCRRGPVTARAQCGTPQPVFARVDTRGRLAGLPEPDSALSERCAAGCWPKTSVSTICQ